MLPHSFIRNSDYRLPTIELLNGYLMFAHSVNTYVPVPPSFSNPMTRALKTGSDYHQMLEISLAPGDKIVTEPGAMVMTSGDLKPRVGLGSLQSSFNRTFCAGENLFRLTFENTTSTSQFLSIAPSGIGKVLPLPLEQWSGVTLSKGAFLAAYGDNWNYELKIATNLSAAFFGGQGLILPTLTGTGTVFITASGSVEIIHLKQDEEIIVNQANVVAFQQGIRFEARMIKDPLVCLCGGMGVFNALFTGPGKVIVQTLPHSKLATRAGIKESN